MLEVGYVAKAHGLSGELSIVLHWAGSDAVQVGRHLELRLKGRTQRVSVIGVRSASKGLLVRFRELSDRDQAEAWKQASVWADRGEQPPLQDGEYYLTDLIGAQVFSPDGLFGEVVRVQPYPSVDALVVQTPDGQVVEQPLLDHWLEEVDVAGKRVVLKSLDGLI